MWSFSILHSGIPAVGILWLVNFDSLCQHLNRSLGFERVEWYKHGERLNPFHTAHFGILTFDIFARETDWWTEVFGKMLTGTHLLSSRRFSLARFFAASPLFSLAWTDREPGAGFYGYAPWQPDRMLPMPRDWRSVSWYSCSFTQSCHWLNSF